MKLINGYLKLIIGPMFSGKSSELIKYIRRYNTINKNILIITHESDTRYETNAICTHDKIKIDCIAMDKLKPIWDLPNYLTTDIIFIEEAQFFDDLFDFVTKSIDDDKKSIIIAGLDGDFKRKKFGQILDLIPHADEVVKINALCRICNDGTVAPFTVRLDKKTKKQIKVGSDDMYEAVCRKHYLENMVHITKEKEKEKENHLHDTTKEQINIV